LALRYPPIYARHSVSKFGGCRVNIGSDTQKNAQDKTLNVIDQYFKTARAFQIMPITKKRRPQGSDAIVIDGYRPGLRLQ
jgi:hypothetical protein